MRELPDPLAGFKAKQKDLLKRDDNANASLKVNDTPAPIPQGGVRLPDGRVVRPRQGGR
ncbi:hypothetical protein D3C72_2323530 [compost metagenome]